MCIRDSGNTDEGGTQKRCALAADVQNAEIFSGFLSRNDLCKIGTGERLDSALEHTHADGKEPEMKLGGHEKGKDGDSQISEDAQDDQACRLMIGKMCIRDRSERDQSPCSGGLRRA